MSQTQGREDIIKSVKSIISQALKVDESKIQLESSLIKDLGAESIDFLDIVSVGRRAESGRRQRALHSSRS